MALAPPEALAPLAAPAMLGKAPWPHAPMMDRGVTVPRAQVNETELATLQSMTILRWHHHRLEI
jgi:hypothetical protein